LSDMKSSQTLSKIFKLLNLFNKIFMNKLFLLFIPQNIY